MSNDLIKITINSEMSQKQNSQYTTYMIGIICNRFKLFVFMINILNIMLVTIVPLNRYIYNITVQIYGSSLRPTH